MACRRLLVLIVAGLSTAAGCATWHIRRDAQKLPVANTMKFDQLVVYSNTPLPARHRLLDELNAQRGTVNGKLGLPPSDELIHVYLFNEASDLRAYVRAHYPDFPERRAMFIESDTRLEVYAFWGDRVAEDLRHEVAHGYLHSVVPRIALWLDEGLAEYFEVPRGGQGLNIPHVRQLATEMASGWQPDMVRLERLQSAGSMDQRDYAEAWAWAHLLMETTPERLELLRTYLSDLRTSDSHEPISSRLARLDPEMNKSLMHHVAGLASSLR
ncbi:MAG TPA: DUF1570 domain-containing protein [Pirellulales bacterium]|jgi:hypothetical protein|nr:DUF1570 domain-containing protein [Pirellulales bacterium]